jgi:putative hydrolase of the HAD superfamily
MTPARAVVFDLGGVVVDWQPERLIATAAPDAATRERVRREIFEHPDWLELDRGTLGHDDAIRRFAARSGLDESRVAALLVRVPPSLIPRPDTLALLRALHAGGHALYYLSNMGEPSFGHLERSHDFWPLFAGGIVSCRVRLLKPEAAIFDRLLQQYGLAARATVFIDDLQRNVDAAAALGLTAIRFTSAAQCEQALRAFLEF